ncbi:hypothetical protein PENTCL1PPCAC_106, partial [Pristionchus entomophagus]
MKLPTIGNDQDNVVIRGELVKDPAWIGVTWNRGGLRSVKREKNFARFSTCESSEGDEKAGSQMRLEKCTNSEMGSFIGKSGY